MGMSSAQGLSPNTAPPAPLAPNTSQPTQPDSTMQNVRDLNKKRETPKGFGPGEEGRSNAAAFTRPGSSFGKNPKDSD